MCEYPEWLAHVRYEPNVGICNHAHPAHSYLLPQLEIVHDVGLRLAHRKTRNMATARLATRESLLSQLQYVTM
jgi:hypothetical protein